jgi:hypothetical protein
VVADELINSAPPSFDALKTLESAGWGVIALPPSWYPDDVRAQLLEQFAEHIEEFVRHDYAVVCLGACDALAEPLGHLGLQMPPSIIPASEAELSTFLRCRHPAAPSA